MHGVERGRRRGPRASRESPINKSCGTLNVGLGRNFSRTNFLLCILRLTPVAFVALLLYFTDFLKEKKLLAMLLMVNPMVMTITAILISLTATRVEGDM